MKRISGLSVMMIVLAVSGAATQAHAQLEAGQAASGLKEALTTGTADAISLVGKPGGYLNNPAIKIGLPKSLEPIASALRKVGLGSQIDKFVESMNSAAEAAAPKAKPILTKAIEDMSFSDAQQIVTKSGHSATDYFQRKTTPELTAAFTPIVKESMAKYSVTKQYDELIGKYQSGAIGELGSMFGGSSHENFDVTSYVVHKSLDGLFYEVGQQEEKIRTNPAAQVTPLLRSIFGGH